MRLVSAEEAQERLDSLQQGHVTNTKAHIQHLYETILALWPIVKKAAREPCDCGKGYECPTLETITLSDWCSRCLARRLVVEPKETKP